MKLATKPLRLTRKNVALAGVLAATAFALSAEVFGPAAGDEVVEVARPGRPARPSAAITPGEAESVIAGSSSATVRLKAEAAQNPFAQLNLRPPAPAVLGIPEAQKPAVKKPDPTKTQVSVAPVPPAPAVAPVAPPLPFIVVGSIDGQDVTEGQPVAFLQQRETLLVVRKGESISQLYRVESITAEKIEFTYLPLNQRQWLSIAQ